MRALLFAVVYLLTALALEKAFLPQLRIVAPALSAPLFELQLLAMAGVLAGLLRGELAGLGIALVAAFCFGVMEIPGTLGPSIVSFALTGWVAGWLARHFRLQGSITRWMTIAFLLLAERFIWTLVHWLVWRDTLFGLPWSMLLAAVMTALLGAILLKMVSAVSRRTAFV